MTACETTAIGWLLLAVAAGLLWAGWGLWALHEQRARHLRLETLADEQAAEWAALLADLGAEKRP